MDVYLFEDPSNCDTPFVTRCEVINGVSTGGFNECGGTIGGYNQGWFRETDDGLEFWGSQRHDPPLEPGFSNCLDAPEMCQCHCPDIQPE